MSRLLLTELRRISARRLVRLLVLLIGVAAIAGGLRAFLTTSPLSERGYQQRVQEAAARRAAAQTEVRQCIREHQPSGSTESPSDATLKIWLPDKIIRAHDPRFHHTRWRAVLQASSVVLAAVAWLLGASLIGAEDQTDLDGKARLVERAVHRYAETVAGLDAVAVDRIGKVAQDPDTQNAGTQLLKITVQGTERAAGRGFSARMVELALSGYPGLYSLGPPQPGSAFGVYWPALLDQALLDHTVHHHDGTTETIAPTGPAGNLAAPVEYVDAPAPTPWTNDELVVAPLGEIVHARSGDKGGDANLGVWGRDPAAWDWLRSTLTVDELRRLLPELRGLPIERYELPNLGAVNFVIRGLLGTGATSSLRLDAQAKALGEWLHARTIKAPRALVET